MNWKKVGIVVGAIVVPGGLTALVGYKAYKHFTKPAAPEAKPFTDCYKCNQCKDLIRVLGMHRWMQHMMDDHGISSADAQATVMWLHKEVNKRD